MPHTKEQRDRHALCGAKKRDGTTCRLFAGQGTSHKGIGACRLHGGATRNHQKAAVRVEAERRLLAIGEPVKMNPVDALIWSVNLSAGHLEFIRTELANFDEADGFKREVLLRLYSDERDRLARTAKLAVDAGVAEKAIKIAEAAGEQLARLITAILGDLALNKKQREAAPSIIRRHLVAIDLAADERPALPPGRVAS